MALRPGKAGLQLRRLHFDLLGAWNAPATAVICRCEYARMAAESPFGLAVRMALKLQRLGAPLQPWVGRAFAPMRRQVLRH
jgi:hypothetical protein